jgi:hypothetical protein
MLRPAQVLKPPGDPAVKIFIETVRARHLVALAAFFVDSPPGVAALLRIVLNPEGDNRTNAGEGIAHQRKQGAAPKTDQLAGIDRVPWSISSPESTGVPPRASLTRAAKTPRDPPDKRRANF